MKIAMFTNYYFPSLGGIETSVFNLSRGLKSRGHDVHIFAPEYPGWKKEENIFRYKSLCFNYKGYLYALPITFFSNTPSDAKKIDFDIFHSHQPYSLGDEALALAKEFKKPLVFTYHIRYEDYSHYIPIIPAYISKKYIRRKTISYANQCNAVIAPSSAIKNLILAQGAKERIEVIPSGIDIKLFQSPRNKREEIRKKYALAKDDLILVTASRVAPEKNIGFLINAFSEISKKCARAKLMIVGEGSSRKDLEKKVQDLELDKKVIFTGLVDKGEMPDFYRASDIFVFSSFTETQGLVAVEAMASGLPVVAIRASGIEDIVDDGKNGFLVSNSAEEFSRKVLSIINDENLKARLAVQAKIDSGKFSIESWTDKIVELYKSLI